MRIELIQHTSGFSLYINDTRVAGSKPWGGGTTIAKWEVNPSTVLKAMGINITTTDTIVSVTTTKDTIVSNSEDAMTQRNANGKSATV